MDIHKRAKIQKIGKFPLELWCEVMTFFQAPSDFMSICVTIKGLYEHVKKISPRSTRNIEFSVVERFPEVKTLLHVSKLIFFPSKIADVDNQKMCVPILLASVYENFQCSSFKEIFEKIFRKFPNLIQLDMHLTDIRKHDGFDDTLEHLFLDIESNTEQSFPLVNLRINMFECDINFNFFLPKLEELLIVLKRKESDEENKIEKKDLFLNFEKLPKLVTLDLQGWKLNQKRKGGIEKISNTMKHVKIVDTDHSIKFDEKFPNLKKLSLYEVNKFDFSNLGKVRGIELVTTRNEGIESIFEGTQFPELEIIRVGEVRQATTLEEVKDYKPKHAKCEIRNSKSVKEVYINNSPYPVFVNNLPSLKKLVVSNFKGKFNFPSYKKDLLGLRYLKCSGYFFSNTIGEKKKSGIWEAWKKNLEKLKVAYSEISNGGEEDENKRVEKLSFVGFQKLKNLFLFDGENVVLEEISDCTNLAKIQIPLVNKTDREKLGSTKDLIVDFKSLSEHISLNVGIEEIDYFYEFLRKMNREVRKSIHLSFFMNGSSELDELGHGTYLVLGAPELRKVTRLEIYEFGFVRVNLGEEGKRDENMVLKQISVRNALGIISHGIKSLEQFHAQDVEMIFVSDCENLESIKIGMSDKNLKDLKTLNVGNLPSCKLVECNTRAKQVFEFKSLKLPSDCKVNLRTVGSFNFNFGHFL